MFAAVCCLGLLATSELPLPEPAPPGTTVEAASTRWQAASANFVVHSFHAGHDARQVAAHCERWRTKLQKYWITESRAAWQTKCEVVVHATRSSYLSVVGAGA